MSIHWSGWGSPGLGKGRDRSGIAEDPLLLVRNDARTSIQGMILWMPWKSPSHVRIRRRRGFSTGSIGYHLVNSWGPTGCAGKPCFSQAWYLPRTNPHKRFVEGRETYPPLAFEGGQGTHASRGNQKQPSLLGPPFPKTERNARDGTELKRSTRAVGQGT